jgi:hypothetical protein
MIIKIYLLECNKHKMKLTFSRTQIYVSLMLLILCFSNEMLGQEINFRIGQTQTSTPFRTSTIRQSGNHLLFTTKRGWAGEIGMEYAIKPKSSFYRISDFKSKPLGRRSYIYTRCDRRVRLLV